MSSVGGLEVGRAKEVTGRSHGLLGGRMPFVSREARSGLKDDEIFLEVLI